MRGNMKAKTYAAPWLRLLLAAALIHFSSGVAFAAEGAAPDPAAAAPSESGGFDATHIGASTLDVVIIRPLGMLASAVGLAMFVVSAPFVAPSRDFDTSWDVFVVGPAEYTFVRPLGTL